MGVIQTPVCAQRVWLLLGWVQSCCHSARCIVPHSICAHAIRSPHAFQIARTRLSDPVVLLRGIGTGVFSTPRFRVPHGSVLLPDCPAYSGLLMGMRAVLGSWYSRQTRQPTRFAVSCVRAALRGALLLFLEGHICVTSVLAKSYNRLIDPRSCLSANSRLGPSKKRPGVRLVLLMSNPDGARWADIVPSNVGTLGLEDGRDIDEFIPLWYEFRCMSPLFPLSSSCVGRSLSRSLLSWSSRVRASLSSMCSRVRVSLKASCSQMRVSQMSSWSRVRVSLKASCSRMRVSRMSSWSRVRVLRVSSWSRMCDIVLRAGSMGSSWPTGDGWNSNSGRSLAGIPVGVDCVYGVLAVGALTWRVVERCAGSHLCRNSVRPTCIASKRHSCSFPRARPSLLMSNMSEFAFSEANCTSRRHLLRCSNFSSHPLIMTSMSIVVIGMGGVGLPTLGSSSLNWTSSSPTSWRDSISLILWVSNCNINIKIVLYFFLFFFFFCE